MAMITAVETRPGANPDRARFTTALETARAELTAARGINPAGPADLPGAIGRAVLATLLPPRRARFSARKAKCATSRYLNRDDGRPATATTITAISIQVRPPLPGGGPARTHRRTSPTWARAGQPAATCLPPSSPASRPATGAEQNSRRHPDTEEVTLPPVGRAGWSAREADAAAHGPPRRAGRVDRPTRSRPHGGAGPHLVDLLLDARAGPPVGVWSHAWEQEYRDVDGLLGGYLRHPFHWTCTDRWFGCEVPTLIVLLALAHVYRWADGPVLPGAEGSMSEASSFASADCAVADVYGPTATSDATSADASPGVSVTGGSTRRASIR
ncbi:MAG TPA: hypothetical protein VGH53_08045 [Streptosporangiaceae bacterium]|jgi:hypothetical protein